MTTVPAPAPTYRGPAAHTSGARGDNYPVLQLRIHSTVSPCVPGGAEAIARYFRSAAAGGSAHYVIDPATEVQVVWDDTIAWHAPPNAHSLGFEMCDIPGPVPGDKPHSAAWKAARRAWRWRRPEQQAMLHRTARLVAQSALHEGVPLRWLGVRQVRAGARGITSHANVSLAFGQSTHWDPGFWPRRRFMRLVRHYAVELRAEYDPATRAWRQAHSKRR